MERNKEEQSSVRNIFTFPPLSPLFDWKYLTAWGVFYESDLFDVSYAVASRRVFAAFGESTWS